MRTNPPVTGRVRRTHPRTRRLLRRPQSPSRLATIHALLHGRVLFQYPSDVRGDELRALDRLARRDTHALLLFENQTHMRARIAATAYLSIMTCHASTLRALDAFRARRRDFAQRF